ncbi:acyl-ACP--UDP-N-acetylglucosamine O-acyltransferase [Yersinia pekkanenii]|uniref:Acyl-[acyl-carrier-protein]--udp-N-acetylglucos amine O-acyltransferase n=1 Tax=Yersinia pekkanenii TaxID=1288385 RepID=A0A0T9NGF3_9GAMM|nr:acyl-ACP--UDP-N-acetylglucosamine O-acyltransferase [Yersinia pekkanenii]CNH07072.1 acyl-[acyl-carrier-protein]--udp-N-acetylglucos amine O-acyltransferase [Yersinia pekkanenii]CRY64561.1 acyl-[acyl-carrier-protein]--udp-N-acetylglucos amine O-acyltransferase [Yersinia pekkanenii]
MIDNTAIISASAIIEKGAVIGANVQIGHFCHIGSQVTIGSGTVLKSHIVINGLTELGCDNNIGQFCSIGEVNQDLKYKGEQTRVVIGNGNLIQQNVTIHRGTIQGSGVTYIGDNNNLMSHVHIGHDCVIGNHCLLASNVGLAGHVEVDDFAVICAASAVHQFCVIGTHAMIKIGACVVQDIPPYVIAEGNRAVPVGIRDSGMGADWLDSNDWLAVQNAYQLIYHTGKLVAAVDLEIEILAREWQILQSYKPFFSRSARGIIR